MWSLLWTRYICSYYLWLKLMEFVISTCCHHQMQFSFEELGVEGGDVSKERHLPLRMAGGKPRS